MEMPQRVEKLERERWLYLGIAALGGVAGLLGALVGVMKGGGGAAGSVAIRDAKNNVRIEMGVDKSGQAQIQLRDPQAKVRQVIAVAPDGQPVIRLLAPDGKTVQAAMMLNPDGLPRLETYDPKGTARGVLGVDANGDGMVQLVGPDGRPRVLLEDTAQGGAVVVNDSKGAKRGSLPP